MTESVKDVSEIYQSCVGHKIKTRIRLRQTSGIPVHRAVTLCVTPQSSLLCFDGGYLVFAVRVPFTECKKIFVYRAQPQDFIVVLPEHEMMCVIVDPLKQNVIKKWTGITDTSLDISAPDDPALVMWCDDSTSKRVTHRNWEDSSSPENHSSSETSSAVKDSINRGLRKQLSSTRHHLNLIEERNSQLESSLRRTLTCFKDSLQRSKPQFNMPSFSVPVLNVMESVSKDDLGSKLDLRFSPLWQNIHNDEWIIGCSAYNNSHWTLKNVTGLLTSHHCKTSYYKTTSLGTREAEPALKFMKAAGSHHSTRKDSFVPWDGTLDPGHSLTLILITALPEFKTGEHTESSVFLTCQVSDRNLHFCLGKIKLNFHQYLQGTYSLESSDSGLAWDHRIFFGLYSLLPFKKTVCLAGRHSPVEGVLSNASSKLALKPLQRYQTFYRTEGLHSVLVKCGEPQSDRIELEICCKLKRDWLIFARSFSSVLPDDCMILPLDVPMPDRHRLAAVLDSQLSTVLRCVRDRSKDDDDVDVVAESPAESNCTNSDLQQLRERFLQENKSVKSLFGSVKQQSSCVDIAASDYKSIQGIFIL